MVGQPIELMNRTTTHEYTLLEPINSDGLEEAQLLSRNHQKKVDKFFGLFMKCFVFVTLILLAYAVLKYLFANHHNLIKNEFICKKVGDPRFQEALTKQKKGLVDVRLKNGLLDVNGTWTLIPPYFNNLWKEQLNKTGLVKLEGGDETKYFVPFCHDFTQQHQQRKCSMVTFGVGHYVTNEQKLLSIYPECHLVAAADPSAEINANLTHDLGGTFVHAAIGGETVAEQQETLSVEPTGVVRKMVNQIGIVDFMNTYTNWKNEPIDLLLIDIEGAEFTILEQLAYHYERFTGSICQFNMEVHDPDILIANYTHQQFFRSLDTLLRSGHFALMNTDMYTGAAPLHLFLRMFFVNVVDEKCTKKFFC